MPRAALSLLAGALAGALAVPGATTPPLSLAVERFAIGGITGRLEWRLDGRGQRLRARVDDIDLPRLAAFLGERWPALREHSIKAGHGRLDLDCRFGPRAARDCDGSFAVTALDVSGRNSAERATFTATGRYTRGSGGDERLTARIALSEGAIYVEPGFEAGGITPGLLWSVDQGPITMDVNLARSRAGAISLQRLRLDHPGVADLAFEGDLALGSALQWRTLDVKLEAPDLARLYSIYAQPLLLGSGFDSLTGAGRLELTARGTQGRLTELALACHGCRAADEHGRFALDGIEGGLAMHTAPSVRTSTLAWSAARVLGLAFGPGRIDWASSVGRIRAVAWQDVTLFDGLLSIADLQFTDLGTARARLSLRGELTPVTLSQVTRAFGWPPLSGQLSGVIPLLTYGHGRLAVAGNLDIQVFGGHVRLRDLRIGDLFGAVPWLTTDVLVEGLDLADLTGTFSFGNIQGTLAGHIDKLRLEAWQPVSFDAYFATPPEDRRPHRISRQAVNNLSRLGAGTSGALGQGWLALIPAYSYGELGLGCTLANGYCMMRGVEPAEDDSFYLLTRGGWLPPWIEIKGSGARIAWDELVDGLRQIARGEWEIDVGVGR